MSPIIFTNCIINVAIWKVLGLTHCGSRFVLFRFISLLVLFIQHLLNAPFTKSRIADNVVAVRIKIEENEKLTPDTSKCHLGCRSKMTCTRYIYWLISTLTAILRDDTVRTKWSELKLHRI